MLDIDQGVALFTTMFDIAFWCSMMLIMMFTIKIAWNLGKRARKKH